VLFAHSRWASACDVFEAVLVSVLQPPSTTFRTLVPALRRSAHRRVCCIHRHGVVTFIGTACVRCWRVQATLADAQQILDVYGPKPQTLNEDGEVAPGADAAPAPALTDSAKRALAVVPVMNEAVLARAQRVAYLLS
jgi:hypothetical protein